MTEPRDPVDAWLEAEVEPLPPPPGTFERIGRRARRRRASRALMSVAGAAVVAAAAVATPQVVSGLLPRQAGSQAAAAGGTSRSTRPAPGATSVRGSQSPRPATLSPTPTPGQASSLSPGGSGQRVPPNFQPTSVTFINTSIGAVIGQAGSRGHCSTQYCTSLAGTSDYGKSWYGVSAPVTGMADGATGVSQLRFLDGRNGWAFGPQLWVTHDGGASWRMEQTYGLRVIKLETAGTRAFALLGDCSGAGHSWAAACTRLLLFSSAARSDSWLEVPGVGVSLAAGQQATSASLVLAGGPAGGAGYVLAPSGEVFSGSLTDTGWGPVGKSPCPRRAAGSPTGSSAGILAAGSHQLYLACTAGAGKATRLVYVSATGGNAWRLGGVVSGTGTVTSLAAAAGNVVVLATTTCIQYSADNGVTWQEAGYPSGGAPKGGFSYVGMTTETQGVAVPADSALHELYITGDGGRTWQLSAIAGG